MAMTKKTSKNTGKRVRSDRFNWKPGDVKIYKNMDELRKTNKKK